MIQLIMELLIRSLAIYVAASILPGVHLADWVTAIIVSITLGVINTFIKPVLVFITLPITLLSLGLFMIVINAVLIMLADWLITGFEVENLGWAVLFSLLVYLITFWLHKLEGK